MSSETSSESSDRTAFSSLGLHPSLLRAVEGLGFTHPTPIQSEGIPPGLAGRDVLACAATGSGKTAAFLLPILQRLIDTPRGTTRALVLTPTRELAAQIVEHFEALARHTRLTAAAVYGGVGMGPQERAFRQGADLLVACPGRLLDHFRQPYAKLAGLEVLVLDEVDRMLDMGFLPDVKRVLRHLPEADQHLFYSATLPAPIAALASEILDRPVKIAVERPSKPAAGITQALFPVRDELKRLLLLELLERGELDDALVFTRTKHRANRLADFLQKRGISADRIHGNRSQKQRTAALADFKSGKTRVLVATDIAARGIDIAELSHVVNFDVPNVPEDYIHRIGRTARAAATGDAFTFVGPGEETLVRAIERALGKRVPRRQLDGFDYQAVPAERLEIPVQQRLAAHRAQRSQERARSAGKGQPGRAGGRPGGGRPGSGRPGSGRPSSGRPSSGRPSSGRPAAARPEAPQDDRRRRRETRAAAGPRHR